MSSSFPYTREMAKRLFQIDFSKLSPHCIELTKMAIVDFIGVAIAGTQKKESKIWRNYYRTKPDAPQASLFLPGFPKASIEQAAALNAVAGHVMDLDDVHNASISHLGVITIPTAFALGQYFHQSGTEIISAIIAGYETGARIGQCINPSSYQYWHTTGVVGSFASGITAGKLLNLSEDQLVFTMGSAGTQAAGLWEFLSSGSMSKVLHTANANLCGIRSALLAKESFTGAPAILEGERGFVRAVAPQYKLECLIENWGNPYSIEENSFKPYACCRHTHSGNYCMEKMMTAYRLNWEEIEEIVDETYGAAIETTDNANPENAYGAKFSFQFCIAAMLLLHDLSDPIFCDENIQRKDIQSLMQKIKMRMDPQLDAAFKADPNRWPHRLTIRLRDGRTMVEEVDYPIGDFQNPFSWEMVEQKFRTITGELLSAKQIDQILDGIRHLELCQDINDVFQEE